MNPAVDLEESWDLIDDREWDILTFLLAGLNVSGSYLGNFNLLWLWRLSNPEDPLRELTERILSLDGRVLKKVILGGEESMSIKRSNKI